jgi:hypothetical protein
MSDSIVDSAAGGHHLHVPFGEKLKAIPGFFGIHLSEQPLYEVLKQEGDFELREYEPILIATTLVHGDYKKALDDGFVTLAKYIFGENQTGQKMAMTIPVMHGPVQAELSKRVPPIDIPDFRTLDHMSMSFVLPSEIKAATAPMPKDSAVHLVEVPNQTWAVKVYSDHSEPEEIRSEIKALQKWLSSLGHKADLRTLRVAQYDAPSTIAFLRRSEVQVRLWSEQNFN